jgi:hypothetical protein
MEEWMESEGSRSFPLRRTLNGPLGARALQVYKNHKWRKPLETDEIPDVGQWVVAVIKEAGKEPERCHAGLGRIVGIVRKGRSAELVIVPAMYECEPELSTWVPGPIALKETFCLDAIFNRNYHALREGVVLSIA